MFAAEDAALTTPIVQVSHPVPEVALVVLYGEHDLASEAEVGAAIAAELAAGNDVVVGLGETLFIDSRIIGVLIRESAHAADAERELVLQFGPESPARRVLEITTVDQHLRCFETTDSAVEAILEKRSGGSS
jgi:anti-anti-sigma factor